MAVTEDLRVQVVAETGQAQQALTGFGGAVQQLVNTFRSGEGVFGGIAQGMGAIGSAAGSLVGIASVGYGIHEAFQMVAESVQETVKWNLEAGKLGRQLGITTEDASVLANTLEDNGIEIGAYTRSVGFMVRALNNGSPAFAQLGVSTRDSNGELRNSNDIFVDVIDKLRGIENPTKQAQLGMQLLGRSWMESREVLRINSEALEKTKRQMEELGTVVTPQTEAASRAYSLAIADVKDVIAAFGINLGNFLIPTLTELAHKFAEELTKAVVAFREALGTASELAVNAQVNFAGLGSVLEDLKKSFFGSLESSSDLEKSLGIRIPSASEQIKKSIREVTEAFDFLGSSLANLLDRLSTGGGQLQTFFNTLGLTINAAYTKSTAEAIATWQSGMAKIESENNALLDRLAKRQADYDARVKGRKIAALSTEGIGGGEELPSGTGMAFAEPKKGSGRGDVGKDTSGERLKAWKQELDEIKAARENWFTWDNQRELEFWQKKLGDTRRNTAAYKGVLSEVVKLQKGINKEQLDEQEAQIRRDMDARARADDVAIAEIHESTKRKMDAAKQASALGQEKAKGESDVEAIGADEAQKTQIALHATQQQLSAEEALAAELKRLRQEDLQQTLAAERMKLDARLSSLDTLRALHATDEKFQQKITDDQVKLIEAAAKVETKAKETELAAQERDASEAEKRRLAAQIAVNKARAADEQRVSQKIQSYLDPFVQGFGDGIRKILSGTLSLGDAVKGMGKMLVTALGDAFSKMVTDGIAWLGKLAAEWIAKQFMMLFATEAVEKGKSAAAAQSAATVIPAKAAEAGAGAAAGAAATPFIGWLIAIPVMIGIVAAVMGLMGGLKSAAGGFDVPSGLNPMTQLHAEEMVLPASLANVVRSAAAGGGSTFGGAIASSSGPMTVNLTVPSLDGKSVSRVLRQNSKEITKVFRDFARDGKGRRS